MAFTELGKHEMLDAFAALAVKVELMGDETGGTGSAVAVPDHAVATQQPAITFGAASGGQIDLDGTAHASGIVFEVPGGWTVTAVRFLKTDGIAEMSRDVLAEGDRETYSNDGTYTLTAAVQKIVD